ncbi:MAG TPA: hydroxymethylglutaryl-CoA reductase, degradative [Candidatus Sulfomarinibacteraceae bacterium]|nr:hydroxymethylglutaryl-CoA reductase, degradative [Candidatus Sulfomarinibacteraceae bacterium]
MADEMTKKNSSRFPGFYKLSLEQRVAAVGQWAGLGREECQVLLGQGLRAEQAAQMIENGIGTHALPLGIAVNFLVNDRDYLIPMAVEEPSVLAAVSHAAKLVRAGGGFHTEATPPVMIGQIQVLDVPDLEQAAMAVLDNREMLMAVANECSQSIVRRGGGAQDIEVRPFADTPVGSMLVVHLLYDTRDAMGANAVNTAVETMAPVIEDLTGGRVNLRILSNLTDRRMVTARCTAPAAALARDDMDGEIVARRIEEANAFAVVDPYRAATHNKGIMNGIDAVCIATGNDWRAIEAGAHAYAARDGQYRALTEWRVDDNGDLYGEMTLPMAVGTVGGATRVHPTAQVAMKILNVASASELGQVMAAVGLAQNLAAIKALATTGIQQGHMRMHARQVALAAGASGDAVETISAQLIADRNIRVARAKELLMELSMEL